MNPDQYMYTKRSVDSESRTQFTGQLHCVPCSQQQPRTWRTIWQPKTGNICPNNKSIMNTNAKVICCDFSFGTPTDGEAAIAPRERARNLTKLAMVRIPTIVGYNQRFRKTHQSKQNRVGSLFWLLQVHHHLIGFHAACVNRVQIYDKKCERRTPVDLSRQRLWLRAPIHACSACMQQTKIVAFCFLCFIHFDISNHQLLSAGAAEARVRCDCHLSSPLANWTSPYQCSWKYISAGWPLHVSYFLLH